MTLPASARVCVLPIEEVIRRFAPISELLRPIAESSIGVRQLSVAGGLVLGAYSGGAPAGTAYKSWRFSTITPYVTGAYFEDWRKSDPAGRFLYLEKVYLHLFVEPPSHDERELVLLHCDPNEPADPPVATPVPLSAPLRHSDYKRAFHLHVSRAKYPLDKAHVAVCRPVTGSSFITLVELMAAELTAIELVREQILRLLRKELESNEAKALAGLVA